MERVKGIKRRRHLWRNDAGKVPGGLHEQVHVDAGTVGRPQLGWVFKDRSADQSWDLRTFFDAQIPNFWVHE